MCYPENLKLSIFGFAIIERKMIEYSFTMRKGNYIATKKLDKFKILNKFD